MRRVLFVCIHNSARSQMAEAFLNHYGRGEYVAESAGLEPGNLNPFVVEAMKEEGIDISGSTTNGVMDFLNEGRQYDAVVTVCDGASGERCPMFPGTGQRLHWEFPDPSAVKGTDEERLASARRVRDMIREKIVAWVEENASR